MTPDRETTLASGLFPKSQINASEGDPSGSFESIRPPVLANVGPESNVTCRRWLPRAQASGVGRGAVSHSVTWASSRRGSGQLCIGVCDHGLVPSTNLSVYFVRLFVSRDGDVPNVVEDSSLKVP